MCRPCTEEESNNPEIIRCFCNKFKDDERCCSAEQKQNKYNPICFCPYNPNHASCCVTPSCIPDCSKPENAEKPQCKCGPSKPTGTAECPCSREKGDFDNESDDKIHCYC